MAKNKIVYDGSVQLPPIPAELLEQYPYAWIRKNTTSGNYDLILSVGAWYFKEEAIYSFNSENIQWYIVPISTAGTATEWVFNKTSTSGFGLDTARTVLWSSHDILNYNSSGIYFKGDGLPGKLVNLTGATVTIPSGWTASAGYGQFNILGSLKATYFPTNEKFSYILDYSHPNFLIGYKPPSTFAKDYLVLHYDKGYTSRFFNNTDFVITFTITGGTDVTNQSLIQWFVDNNAIIEGGVYDEETEDEPTEPIPNLITLAGITVKPKGFPLQEVDGVLPDNPYSLSVEANGKTYNSFAYLEDAIYLNSDTGESLEIMDTTTELKILGGADATNPNLINFFSTNFNAVSGVEVTATITYKGITKVIQAGIATALKFANKKITDDIVIAFTQNGVITYKDIETAVQAGQTATLKCANKKMADDLYITVKVS